MIYQWTEISNIPERSGIYAWYYSPEITNFDVEQAINEIRNLVENYDKKYALEFVKNFLHKYIFQYFREEPYQATLSGSLKPKYEGIIEHIPALSNELVNRIIEDPYRLKAIKQVIEKSPPNFASPIYIGMSDNLYRRVNRHKKLIEQYKIQFDNWNNPLEITNNNNYDHEENNFAIRVCNRNLQITRLFVIINIIEDISNEYNDIENILNRLYFPILGKK